MLLLIVGCEEPTEPEDDENPFICAGEVAFNTFTEVITLYQCNIYDTNMDTCLTPILSNPEDGPVQISWTTQNNCSSQGLCDTITNGLTCEEWCEENYVSNCVDDPDTDHNDCAGIECLTNPL